MVSFNYLSIFKRLLVLAVLITALFASDSFAQTEKYSQVRIFATSQSDFNRISQADLHLDHGVSKPGLYFETWLSASEIELLKKSGVSYQITIDDWDTYYKSLPTMSPAEVQNALRQSKDMYNVSHSIYGTMGGHLKWAEMNNKLDSLAIEYPNLVSPKFSIGNSYQNRALWTVRITKNPSAPTGRPEIWLNAITHAREPVGATSIFYFVYWLVENYNIDPIATYILNNREIYFTPALNPDGYVYNETTNPNGGGMWRKNRTPQGSATGVDLNRNFGTYNFWNSTNNGSSTSPSSDTYRGVAPFSEPETQVFKNFVNSRNFKVQLDYHTYGNLLIKPWAWCDPIPTPDDAIFNQFGYDIVAVNHFTFGTPYQTVGYKVRGGDLDWIYSTDSTGHSNHIFAFTPEVGPSFWPAQSEIMGLVQTTLEMNKYICLVAGPYVNPVSETPNKQTYTSGEAGNFKLVFKNKGLGTAQNVKVEFTPINPAYITVPVQLYTKTSMASMTSDSVTFNFTLSGSVTNGTAVPVRLKLKQEDTVTVLNKIVYLRIGNGTVILADSAENGMTNWTTNAGWGIVTTQYYSPTHSFTDSPTGNYLANANNYMVYNGTINASATPVLNLSFWHKYITEATYDFCLVEISTNNGTTWQNIKSYDGTLSTWTYQSFDISTLANGSSQVKIRFRLTADASLQYDGWYVDDIKVTAYNSVPTGTGNNQGSQIPSVYELSQNYPNPFNPVTQINYSIPKDGYVKITVFDVIGRVVTNLVSENKKAGYYSINFNGDNLNSGVYFYKLESGNFVETKKMILVK